MQMQKRHMENAMKFILKKCWIIDGKFIFGMKRNETVQGRKDCSEEIKVDEIA